MKLEVGKNYKCGNEVVEIIRKNIFSIIPIEEQSYVGRVFCDKSDDNFGVFYKDGSPTHTNPFFLQKRLREIEEPKQGPVIKIEPGKIHSVLFVVLKDEEDVRLSSVFLQCSSDEFNLKLSYYSERPEVWIFSIDPDASTIEFHGEPSSFISIHSDATEAYDAYKKEVEND